MRVGEAAWPSFTLHSFIQCQVGRKVWEQLGAPPTWFTTTPPPCPHRTTIWTHRVRFLEERALPHWATFTIWNAGRQGRRLYRSLTAGMRRKVGPRPPRRPPPPPHASHPPRP